MNKIKRLSPHEVIKLINEGRSDEIPKSKTWHRFMEFRKSNSLSTARLAYDIGIPLMSMGKFLEGTYVISNRNMQKIQEFLTKHA